jgi:hypothetical protein
MLMMNDRVIKQWRSCKPRISVICFLRYSKTQLWRAQVYIYITSLHAFERKSCCRIVVAAANSCNYQYASFSTLSSHTCPHCSLSKCSVSQVVSVYAGYCCCSLRSLYINRNTEGWQVVLITIVVLLQWGDIRVGGYTRSTEAPGLNAYRQVTCKVHVNNFATRSERKSCCRIVVAAANSCNYQSAFFSTLSSHTFHIALWVSAVSHKWSLSMLATVASHCDHCITAGILTIAWSKQLPELCYCSEVTSELVYTLDINAYRSVTGNLH